MAISIVNEQGRKHVNEVFHLKTKSTSYIMAVRCQEYLTHVYWGTAIATPDISQSSHLGCAAFDPMEKEVPFSLNHVRQEYPTGDGTDYRIPALELTYEDGSKVCPLRYDGYTILKGKPELEGLPAIYTEKETEAETLMICLKDRQRNLCVYLTYSVLEEYDVITRSVRIENQGTENVCLEKVMSCSVDFETSCYEMLQLPGAWGRERWIEKRALAHGLQSIESRRGASSHQMNPFFALLEKGADESHGKVYGFSFVYSGNFVAGVEVDQLGMSRAYIGINDYDFTWKLEPKQQFLAPETVLVFSADGLGGMSRIYHRVYRERLVRGKYRDAVRPILANNWEATYFDFTEEKIISLAQTAAKLGIELMVLDDGWFGKRDSDTCSLGDWFVNQKKIPSGIAGLAEKVNMNGVQFGLWFEPEMVSVDSELYRAHPDWCIHVEGRERTECRNQLTLDFSRKEVCDYIIDIMNQILRSAPISYVKWDMNRHMSNLGSAGLAPDRQREMPHRYMLGLYRVMEAVVSANPDVLFESCSGGGGRFDPGMLYYMPQTWTSDDTDPVERLLIQYGTSIVYPISAMGAHVSAVPNHQSGRITSLKMRGDVAMSGNLGYELDLTCFTEEEEKEVQRQIAEYKLLRNFIQSGDMYRLQNPFEGNTAAWMFRSQDGQDIFAAYFRIRAQVNPGIERMKFAGLQPHAVYEIADTGERYRGDELMEIGLLVQLHGDYQSKTWRLRKISES